MTLKQALMAHPHQHHHRAASSRLGEGLSGSSREKRAFLDYYSGSDVAQGKRHVRSKVYLFLGC